MMNRGNVLTTLKRVFYVMYRYPIVSSSGNHSRPSSIQFLRKKDLQNNMILTSVTRKTTYKKKGIHLCWVNQPPLFLQRHNIIHFWNLNPQDFDFSFIQKPRTDSITVLIYLYIMDLLFLSGC